MFLLEYTPLNKKDTKKIKAVQWRLLNVASIKNTLHFAGSYSIFKFCKFENYLKNNQWIHWPFNPGPLSP